MLSSKFTLSAIALATITLSGCAAVDTAQRAYSAVQAGYGAKSAYSSVKDIRNAQPVFVGYSAVVAYAELSPDDQKARDQIRGAFADNIRYLVSEYGRVFGQPVAVCLNPQQCGGRILGVQFSEDAYDANLAEKITMGDRLKGRISYIDVASGRIVAESRVEGVSSYADVLGVLRGSLFASMSKSYPDARPAPEAIEAIPSVKPGYEKLFAQS